MRYVLEEYLINKEASINEKNKIRKAVDEFLAIRHDRAREPLTDKDFDCYCYLLAAKGYSESTICDSVRRVQKFLEFAAQNGFIDISQVNYYYYKRKPKSSRRFSLLLTQELFDALSSIAEHDHSSIAKVILKACYQYAYDRHYIVSISRLDNTEVFHTTANKYETEKPSPNIRKDM